MNGADNLSIDTRVESGTLRAGDDVLRADGSTGEVEFVRVAQQPQRMYNLTVDVAHTFFVGQGQWLVHNAGRCGISLQSIAGAVADANLKGFHINTNISGAELGLRVGANNTILLTAMGRVKVNPGDYVKDVTSLLTQKTDDVVA